MSRAKRWMVVRRYKWARLRCRLFGHVPRGGPGTMLDYYCGRCFLPIRFRQEYPNGWEIDA